MHIQLAFLASKRNLLNYFFFVFRFLLDIKPDIKKLTSHLIELTIVTIGVLIALFVNNLKENNQARKYQVASQETIKNEVEANSSELNAVIEKHG